jgi:FkbM family methyltransferase
MKKALKRFYHWIPFKKNIFNMVKVFWTPPHSIYKHLSFKGIMKVKAGSSSFKIRHHGTEIENDIFWKGLTNGWEKTSMQLWIELCKDAKVIIDVGANTGIYSLTACAVNPRSDVIAFEPLHRIYRKLKENNDLNNYNIKCVEKALSDSVGEARIYENDSEHIAAATLDKFTAETYGEGKLTKETIIKTTTLDKLIEEQNLSSVDLVKIDVETHEPQVIDGFSKFLPRFKPSFLVEVLTDEVGAHLQRAFDPYGYVYYNIDDKNGKLRETKKVVKSDYFNYLMCTADVAKKINLVKQS